MYLIIHRHFLSSTLCFLLKTWLVKGFWGFIMDVQCRARYLLPEWRQLYIPGQDSALILNLWWVLPVQAVRCGTMWVLDRFVVSSVKLSSQWLSLKIAQIPAASFLCGIGAAVLIWRGGQRTKRLEEIWQKLRDAITDVQIPPSTGFTPLSLEAHSSSESARRAFMEGSRMTINISTEKLTQGDEPVVTRAPYFWRAIIATHSSKKTLVFMTVFALNTHPILLVCTSLHVVGLLQRLSDLCRKLLFPLW